MAYRTPVRADVRIAMMNLIFATPWYLLLTLVVVGGVVAWTGNQRQQARTRNVGLGLIGLAAALFTVSFFVETDLEKVKRLNKDLVQSVPDQNWSKLAELLDPDATMGTVDGTFFSNREALVKGAKDAAARWGLKSVTITGTEETQDASRDITIDINVLSKQDATEGIVAGTLSSWRMVWTPVNKDWRCRQILCLKIGTDTGSHVGKYIQ